MEFLQYSSSTCLLAIYRDRIISYIFAKLISSSNYFIDLLQFSKEIFTSVTIKDNCIFLYNLVCLCLLALRHNFQYNAERTAERGLSCLTPNCRINAFSLQLQVFKEAFYGAEKAPLHFQFAKFCFLICREWVLNFVKCFICIY